ncbi:CHAT domain-containing protein [candidate division KSB1 bacterium]|nr:CHAT domain-containing protein [candidate division KSB1 bacterium]
MPKSNYQNFDLEFYESGGLYHVKARSFNGEARHRFALPFALDEAQATILAVEKSLSDHQLDLEVIKKFGGSLFEAVFQNEVRAIYKSSLDLARAQGGEGLRLRLHLQDAPALAHLPWEYLYDAAANQFLCFNRQTPVVRYLDLPKAILPLQIKPPLRILVMISNPLASFYLNVDEEKAKLQQALADLEKRGLVQIHWLETATVNALQKTLRRAEFHVFHFIGHGDFEAAANQGWLAFEDETEAVDRVSAEQLGALLNNHPSLRLVVLNSCKGARAALANPFAGTASTLVQLGIPAVAAMQFAISDAAAIQFAETFYGAVADRLPADVATTEARVALFTGDHHPEWGTPVLFMRSSDGALFVDGKKTPAPPRVGRTGLIYALATLLFAAVTFLILAVLPKSTLLDVTVFAKDAGFALPAAESEEKVALLHSGLLTGAISIAKFKPLKLTLLSLHSKSGSQVFKNPVTITPDPFNSKMAFLSPVADISLQEVVAAAGGQVNLQHHGDGFNLTIQHSPETLYLTLSLEEARLLLQACTVTDGAGRDLTPFFNDTVRVKLHEIARAPRVKGQNGELEISVKKSTMRTKERAQFLLEQPVENLDFSKNVFQGTIVLLQSTIDSIWVSRNFPLDSVSFKARDPGDLELAAEPNRFVIYDLAETANGFKVRAQGRLHSMTVGRGDLWHELVPKYLALITQNRTLSVFITWMGWLMTVLIPFILKLKSKNKSEGADD